MSALVLGNILTPGLLAVGSGSSITGNPYPGETLTSTEAGQWLLNGSYISGETGTTLVVPATVGIGDKISQDGSNIVTVRGAKFAGFLSAPALFRSTARSADADDNGLAPFLWEQDLATLNLLFDGDSITAAQMHSPYPAQAWRALAADGVVSNFGNVAVSGQTLANMESDGASQVDALMRSGINNILFVFAGTNDLAFDPVTPAQTHTRLVTYCTNRRAAGWTVVVATMIRRKATDVTNTEVSDFNTLVRANWTSYADALCDWAGDAAFSDVTNTTYYNADQIHPTQAGQDVLATYAIPAIESLL